MKSVPSEKGCSADYSPAIRAVRPSLPRYSFGKAVRAVQPPSDAPGPGEYDPKKPPQFAVAFKFQGRREAKLDTGGPGPGAYQAAPVSQKASISPSFGKESRNKIKVVNTVPGPGQYEALPRPNAPSATTYSFGKEKLRMLRFDDSPGPGAYEFFYSKAVAGGAFSRAINRTQQAEVPGPGAYSLNMSSVIKSNNPAVTIRSKRPDAVLHKSSPGPGTYTPDVSAVRMKSGFTKFGCEARLKTEHIDCLVGPGNYNPRLYSPTRNVLFPKQERSRRLSRSDLPGPGTYDLKSSLSHKGISFTKSKNTEANHRKASPLTRPQLTTLAHERNKSPNPDKPEVSSLHPTDLKEQKFAGNDSALPGPGTYNLPNKTRFALGIFPRASRNAPHKGKENLGPGSYNPRKPKNSPNWSFPKSPRKQDESEAVPGPGAYEVIDFTKDHPQYALH